MIQLVYTATFSLYLKSHKRDTYKYIKIIQIKSKENTKKISFYLVNNPSYSTHENMKNISISYFIKIHYFPIHLDKNWLNLFRLMIYDDHYFDHTKSLVKYFLIWIYFFVYLDKTFLSLNFVKFFYIYFNIYNHLKCIINDIKYFY